MHPLIARSAAFLALAISGAACLPDARPVSVTASPEPRAVSVTGDADVKVSPDVVDISVGVESIDTTVEATTKKNGEALARMLAAATAAGVDPKDAQTEYIYLEPRYRNYEERDITGYVARRTVKLTVRDVKAFERVLTAVLESGANVVMGVQFRMSDLRKYRDQARALAIQAAKEKAEALAKALGQEIDRPHVITEESSSWSSPFGWWGGGGGGMAQNVSQQAGPTSSVDGTSAPGEIAVNARVRVSFELK